MLENQLKKLGFNKNETKVYLSLFDLGQCKAGQIIERTGLHRNLVYTALEELVSKNVVSKMERSNVAVFEVNDPGILKELVDEKMDAAKDAIEELRARLHTEPRDVRIYEGTEGVVATREKVLREINPKEKYYVMGVSYSTSNKELSKYFPMLNKKIIDKGGDIKVLVAGNESKNIVTERGLTWQKNARYLPFGVNSPMWMTLFRDTMNISIVGQDPITFSIRSQETADGFKKYFEYFWEQKVKTETGIDALSRTIYGMLDELEPGEEYFVLGASSGDNSDDVQKLYDKFHADRIKKGVVTNMLVYRESFDRIKKRFIECGDEKGVLSRLKKYSSSPKIPMQINMFHGRAFMILYADQPTVISFDSQEAHDGFKAYFDQLWNQEIVVDSGMVALKKVFFDMLEELGPGDEYYVIGTGLGGDPKYKDFFLDYHRQRIKKGVTVKMLAYRDQLATIKKDLFTAGGDPDGLISIVKPFVDAPPIPMQVTLYKNRVRIFFSGDEPTVFYFERPEAYTGFKKYFDEFWDQEMQILRGPKALQELWLEMVSYGELRLIGARGYFIDRYPELFKAVEDRTRTVSGAKWKNIVDVGVKGHKITRFPWSETRYNLSTVKNPNVVWLYGDKLAISNWAGDEPIIFTSTNKQLVQTYNDYFDELWKKGE